MRSPAVPGQRHASSSRPLARQGWAPRTSARWPPRHTWSATGMPPFGALQQAFHLHEAAGENLAAAMDVHWIAMMHLARGNAAVGGGWSARGLRLLEGEPDDAEARGFYAIDEFFQHLAAGDMREAGTCAERVFAVGKRWDNGDLIAFGLMSQGRLMIYSGRVAEGTALLDEAMVGLAAGEVSPIVSGEIYCP